MDLRMWILAPCFFSHYYSPLVSESKRGYKIPSNSDVVGISMITITWSICLHVCRYIFCCQTMLTWDLEAPSIFAAQRRQISLQYVWQQRADADMCLALELAHPKGLWAARSVFPLPLTAITEETAKGDSYWFALRARSNKSDELSATFWSCESYEQGWRILRGTQTLAKAKAYIFLVLITLIREARNKLYLFKQTNKKCF